MAAGDSDTQYRKLDTGRLSQGDILRDVSILWSANEDRTEEGVDEIHTRVIPYAVVLTQECDLEQDASNRIDTQRRNDDKFLHSILLVPAYLARSVREGTQLEQDLGFRMQKFNSSTWPSITKNLVYRYHWLPPELALQVPELVMDFKHYCTLPRAMVDSAFVSEHYLASISPMFRENVSQRFAYYLSRIGLPERTEVATNANGN